MQPAIAPLTGPEGWILAKDRVAKSIAFVLILMFVERLVAFARGIAFARLLGTAEYGVYTLGMFVIPLAATAASLGVQSAFGRYVSRYETRGGLRGYLARTYGLTLISAVLLATPVLAKPAFFSNLIYGEASHSALVMVAAGTVPALLLLRNLSTTFMGLKLFRAGRLVESFQTVVYAGAGIALVAVSSFATTALVGFSLSTAVSVAVFLPLVIRYARRTEPAPVPLDEPRFYRTLLAFSIWFMVNPVLAQVFHSVDRFSLHHLMSASDQGIYSATAALAETVSAVGLAVVSVVYPNLSATWEAGDRAKALKDLDLAVRITAVILLVTGVVLVVLGRWLIALLLGDQYGPGAVVLPYLVVYYLFTIHVSIFGIYPPLIEKTYASTIGFTVAMPCTILLNMTLIPRLGIVGAALATMLSYVLMWVIVLSICRRWGLPVKKRTVVMCLLSFALLLPWYASLPVVGLTAYVCARRTWILSAEEKEKAGSDVSRMLALARRVLHQEK